MAVAMMTAVTMTMVTAMTVTMPAVAMAAGRGWGHGGSAECDRGDDSE